MDIFITLLLASLGIGFIALHERYKKEGIVIPYPISAINLQQEQVNPDTIISNKP